MASEPWNRVYIPRPAIQCQLSVPVGDSTGTCIKNLVDKYSAVHSFLKSKTLNSEVTMLDSILYVYHHKLGFHKPYRALKQVQQCTKRIKSMGLEDSLKEMMDLCPKSAELESAQYCTVPSQPILELVSMKILGSCKLLVRLVDCCYKAFHLCLQHLKLAEYIVVNVVLLGLLSRLWVLYKGLLKDLVVLYSMHISLQKEVSDFQKMPYFKDFVFPDKIEDHIGSVLNEPFANKPQNLFSKKEKLQILTKIFRTSDLVKEEKISQIENVGIKEAKESLDDVGQPIQIQGFKRGKPNTFDIKTLSLPVKASKLQGFRYKNKSNESKKKPTLSHHPNKEECVRHMVPKIQEAEDFKVLSKQLLYAVKWCKERKLKREVMFFRNRYLRCNRLQHAEALGYSLKKKLQCWKKSLCHRLRGQMLSKDHPKRYLSIQRFQRNWKSMATSSQRHRRVKRKALKISLLHLDLCPEEPVPPSTTVTAAALRPPTSEHQESITKETDRCLPNADDIDDIFSSIGI
ncbi:nucleolus and neural progenitor protein [Leptodactylus fuscus]|uniref:nucleolus and neural progenitor protein n=1 Tax=Leptodactylus fuscus TaxID=238119 RepID=UPI003F4EA315